LAKKLEKEGDKVVVKDSFEVCLNKWGDIHLKKAVRKAFPFKEGETLIMKISKDEVRLFPKSG